MTENMLIEMYMLANVDSLKTGEGDKEAAFEVKLLLPAFASPRLPSVVQNNVLDTPPAKMFDCAPTPISETDSLPRWLVLMCRTGTDINERIMNNMLPHFKNLK
jgi:hypothetical protein